MRRRIGNLLVESRRNPGTASIAAGLVLALAVTPALFAPGLYDDFTLAKQASLLVAAALVAFGLAWDGEPWPRRRLVRHLLWAWIALLAVSFWSGLDTRGSVLGYYQYRQGLLSQVSYVVLFLGALKLSRSDGIRWLPLTGAVGLAAATAYTAVQSLGRDPVDWWIDTSARAIGTIGNANELAAYGVLAVAFAAAGVTASSRRAIALAIAVAACSGFVILQSESRSGLIALAILVAIFPVAAAIVRQGKRRAMRGWLTLVTGLALGGLAGIVVGGAGGTASRIQSGMAAPEADGSTRIELWKGTVHTIAASPLVGFGPDGLHLAFPRHRPDGLGGAFIHYDLVAQSSHNLALDIAANEGIPALAVIVALFATVGVGSLRRERANPRDGWAPLTWAAMAGYVALTMVNPVSLAPHALFFILLGVLEGRAEQELPVPAPPALSRPARVAFASPWLLALGGIAVLLPIADLHANRAWEHYSRGEFDRAAGEYQSASRLLPFERTYAASVAGSWLAAGVDGGPPALQQAVRAYESFDRDFGFTSGEAIGLATARIGLGTTVGVERLLDRSVRLNPHGLTIEAYTAQLRLAAAEGGTLLYAARDHWVRVVPNTERAGR